MSGLPVDAWLDADGRHVWWRHACVDGEHTYMLPWPAWKKGDSGTTIPSIVCMRPGCSYHASPLVGQPPDDWKPRKTIEELMSGPDSGPSEKD